MSALPSHESLPMFAVSDELAPRIQALYRPLEDYTHLGKDFTDRHGAAMASVLGRNLWFGNRATGNGAVDMSKYETTWAAARR